MKLVVGLGNPGRKYQNTRHNVGFEVIAELARRYGLGRPKPAFQGELTEASFEGQRALLLCPHTLMNRSGRSVAETLRYYKLETADLLVVCDCMNLPLGKLRLRPGGSAGGHNGLADVGRWLGGNDFPRLRIGIGRPPEAWDPADYVLARFTKNQRGEIDAALMLAADAVIVWAREGLEPAMNQFN